MKPLRSYIFYSSFFLSADCMVFCLLLSGYLQTDWWENKGSIPICVHVFFSKKKFFSNHPFLFHKEMVVFKNTHINVWQTICKLFLGFLERKAVIKNTSCLCFVQTEMVLHCQLKKSFTNSSSYTIFSNCFLLSHLVRFTAFSIIYIFQNRHLITLKWRIRHKFTDVQRM